MTHGRIAAQYNALKFYHESLDASYGVLH